MAATVASVGTGRVNPSVYLRPMAQPTSRPPARISTSHAIAHLRGYDEVVLLHRFGSCSGVAETVFASTDRIVLISMHPAPSLALSA